MRLIPIVQPRLRTVFVAVNLVILLLPLGGVVLLRLYESALLRRTETALIAQGAVIAAVYREELRRTIQFAGREAIARYGHPATANDSDAQPSPLIAKLNLASDLIYPRPIDSLPARPPDGPARVAGQRLSPILRSAQITTLAGVRVTDFSGVIVASTRGELHHSLAHRMEVRRALTGEYVSLVRARVSDEPPPPLGSISRTTPFRVFVAMPVIHQGRVWGTVVLSRTPMSVGQALFGIRGHIAVGGAVLLSLVILVSAFTSRTVTGPVDRLIRQTERVAAGDRSAMTPLFKPGTLEVSRLSEAFLNMANALDQRTDYIAAFATNLSHEFKTPLTAIRGAVELLRDHVDEMNASDRDRFLKNLDADAERLERLVGRLLELARADVAKPTGKNSRLRPLLGRVASRYQCGDAEVDVRVEPGADSVRMGEEILESILGNLLDNARRHGGSEAKIAILARPGPRRPGRNKSNSVEGRIELIVSDDGPGISEANRARIFDAFFTTARDAGGTGLGLPIVRALLQAHDGTIEVRSEPGRTRFRVELPAGESNSSSGVDHTDPA